MNAGRLNSPTLIEHGSPKCPGLASDLLKVCGKLGSGNGACLVTVIGCWCQHIFSYSKQCEPSQTLTKGAAGIFRPVQTGYCGIDLLEATMYQKLLTLIRHATGIALAAILLCSFSSVATRATTVDSINAAVVANAEERENTTPTGWWVYSGQTETQINAFASANNARVVDISVEAQDERMCSTPLQLAPSCRLVV